MRRIVGVALTLSLLLPLGVRAQDIELATYTPEQRWERASNQLALSWVAAIAYAKASGQTAEDYARVVIDLFVPSWGEAGTGTLNVVGGMNRNYLMFTDAEFEIVDQSEAFVTVRSNRPWVQYFGEDGVWYGVTLEEFETVFKMFNAALGEHLGLGYEEWQEEGWTYMRFTI